MASRQQGAEWFIQLPGVGAVIAPPEWLGVKKSPAGDRWRFSSRRLSCEKILPVLDA
jgi:hypothetical protein